jgi:hypothetical protein
MEQQSAIFSLRMTNIGEFLKIATDCNIFLKKMEILYLSILIYSMKVHAIYKYRRKKLPGDVPGRRWFLGKKPGIMDQNSRLQTLPTLNHSLRITDSTCI